jgi:hypothetical protein
LVAHLRRGGVQPRPPPTPDQRAAKGRTDVSLILLILLIVILVGALPTWPYSSGWGYYPSSGAGLVLLVLIILLLSGRL